MKQKAFRLRAKLARVIPALIFAFLISPVTAGAAPILVEGFTSVPTLAGTGWVFVNNSTAPVIDWFQGNAGIFEAANGPTDSYAAANFLGTASGEISNWMMLPELTVSDGDSISFKTRSAGDPDFPDNLKVLFSPNGASTSVLGFTTLLEINPALDNSYPTAWTTFTATLSGLGGSTSGRFAFLYTIPDINVAGNYIGVDDVSVTSEAVTAVPEPASLTLLAIGLARLGARRYRQTRASA